VKDAYRMNAASGMLQLRIGDFEANVMASRYARGIPYSTDRLQVYFDDPDSGNLERALRLDLKHNATLSTRVQLWSRLYADSYDYQQWANNDAASVCFRTDFQSCQVYDAGLSRWAGLEERLTLNWFEDQSFVTLLGVNGRMRWVSAKEEQLDLATGRPFAPATGLIDTSSARISPYLQQTWTPTRWFDTNVGVRLTGDQRFSPILSPRGAIVVRPWDTTTLKTIYSQAFRAPTFYEMNSSGVRRARAPNVSPEYVRSAEASIEQRFGTQRVMFGVFRTWWDDLIEPRLLTDPEVLALQQAGELPLSAGDVVQSRNVSNIDNWGYNASFDGSLVDGRLSYGTNFTAAHTRRQSSSGPQPLPASPEFFGNARVSYKFGGYIPTPALAVTLVDERPVDRGNRTAPTLARLRATLTGPVPKVTGLAYRVTGNYATASAGPYTTGPTVTGGATVEQLPLNPVDQYSVFFGLRYDFLTGDQGSSEDLP
jgi:outer membrane receptor protein involved in Fe transport